MSHETIKLQYIVNFPNIPIIIKNAFSLAGLEIEVFLTQSYSILFDTVKIFKLVVNIEYNFLYFDSMPNIRNFYQFRYPDTVLKLPDFVKLMTEYLYSSVGCRRCTYAHHKRTFQTPHLTFYQQRKWEKIWK